MGFDTPEALPRQARYRDLAAALLQAAGAVYGQRLVSLAIFGSVGRGTARADSDLDLLVIAEPLPSSRLARAAEFDLVEDCLKAITAELAKSGVRTELSPVFKTRAEADAGSLLFLDLLTDSVILYDREGFLARTLNRSAERLRELGARKIVKGNAWYWDLSPGLKAGEEFRLWCQRRPKIPQFWRSNSPHPGIRLRRAAR